MYSKLLVAAAGASLLLTSVGAEAMPAGTVGDARVAPQVTLAGFACGPGFRLGPGGACRRVRGGPVVVVAPRRVVRPRCGVRVGPVGVRTPC